MSKATHLGADFGLSLDDLSNLSKKMGASSADVPQKIMAPKGHASRVKIWTAEEYLSRKQSQKYR